MNGRAAKEGTVTGDRKRARVDDLDDKALALADALAGALADALVARRPHR